MRTNRKLLKKDQRRLNELLSKRAQRKANMDAREVAEAEERAKHEAEERAAKEVEEGRLAAGVEAAAAIEQEEAELAALEAQQKRCKLRGKDLGRFNELTAKKTLREQENHAKETEAPMADPESDSQLAAEGPLSSDEQPAAREETDADREEARTATKIAAEELEMANVIARRNSSRKKKLPLIDRQRLEELERHKAEREAVHAARESKAAAAVEPFPGELELEPEKPTEPKSDEASKIVEERAQIAALEHKRQANKQGKLSKSEQMRYDELKARSESRKEAKEEEQAQAAAASEAPVPPPKKETEAQRHANKDSAADAAAQAESLRLEEQEDNKKIEKLERKKAKRGQLFQEDQPRLKELSQKRSEREEIKARVETEAEAAAKAAGQENSEEPEPETKAGLLAEESNQDSSPGPNDGQLSADAEEGDPAEIQAEERQLEQLRNKKLNRKKKFNVADQEQLDELEARASERSERRAAREAQEVLKEEKAVAQDEAAAAAEVEAAAPAEADADNVKLADYKAELAGIRSRRAKKPKDIARTYDLQRQIADLEEIIASRPRKKWRKGEGPPEIGDENRGENIESNRNEPASEAPDQRPATEELPTRKPAADDEEALAAEVVAEDEELHTLKREKPRLLTAQDRNRMTELGLRVVERKAVTAKKVEEAEEAKEAAATTATTTEAEAKRQAEAEALAAEITAEEQQLAKLKSRKGKRLGPEDKKRIAELEERLQLRAEVVAGREAKAQQAKVEDDFHDVEEPLIDIGHVPASLAPEAPEPEPEPEPEEDPEVVKAEETELAALRKKRKKRRLILEDSIKLDELEKRAAKRAETATARSTATGTVADIHYQEEGEQNKEKLPETQDQDPKAHEEALATKIAAEKEELARLKSKQRESTADVSRIERLENRAKEATGRAMDSETKPRGAEVEAEINEEHLAHIAVEEGEPETLRKKPERRSKLTPLDRTRCSELRDSKSRQDESPAKGAKAIATAKEAKCEPGQESILEVDEKELKRITDEEANSGELKKTLTKNGKYNSTNRTLLPEPMARTEEGERARLQKGAGAPGANPEVETEGDEEAKDKGVKMKKPVFEPEAEPQPDKEELKKIEADKLELEKLQQRLKLKGKLSSSRRSRLAELEARLQKRAGAKASKTAAAKENVQQDEPEAEPEPKLKPDLEPESRNEAAEGEPRPRPQPEAQTEPAPEEDDGSQKIDEEEFQRIADEEAEMAELKRKLEKKKRLSYSARTRLEELERHSQKRAKAALAKQAETENQESEAGDKGGEDNNDTPEAPHAPTTEGQTPATETRKEELERIADEESELECLEQSLKKKGKLHHVDKERCNELSSNSTARAEAKAAKEAAEGTATIFEADAEANMASVWSNVDDGFGEAPEEVQPGDELCEADGDGEGDSKRDMGQDADLEAEQKRLKEKIAEEEQLAALERKKAKKGGILSPKELANRASARAKESAAKKVEVARLAGDAEKAQVEEEERRREEEVAKEEEELEALQTKSAKRNGILSGKDRRRLEELTDRHNKREGDKVARLEAEKAVKEEEERLRLEEEERQRKEEERQRKEEERQRKEEERRRQEEIAAEEGELASLKKKIKKKLATSKEQKQFKLLLERHQEREEKKAAKEAEKIRLAEEEAQGLAEEEAARTEKERPGIEEEQRKKANQETRRTAEEEVELEVFKEKPDKKGRLGFRERDRMNVLQTRADGRAAKKAEEEVAAATERPRIEEEERLQAEEEERQRAEAEADELAGLKARKKKARKGKFPAVDQIRLDELQERADLRAQEKAARQEEEEAAAAGMARIEEEARIKADKAAAIEAEEEELEALIAKKKARRGKLTIDEQVRLDELQERADERAAGKAAKELEGEEKERQQEEEQQQAKAEAEIETLKAKKEKSKKKFTVAGQERLDELVQMQDDRAVAKQAAEEVQGGNCNKDSAAGAGGVAADDLADLDLENVDLSPEQIEELLAGTPSPKPKPAAPPKTSTTSFFSSIWGRATGATSTAQPPPPSQAPKPGPEREDRDKDRDKDTDEDKKKDRGKAENADSADPLNDQEDTTPSSAKAKTGGSSSKSRKQVGGKIADRLKAFEHDPAAAAPPPRAVGEKKKHSESADLPGAFPEEKYKPAHNGASDILIDIDHAHDQDKDAPVSGPEPEPLTDDGADENEKIEIVKAPPPPLPPAAPKPSKLKEKERDKKPKKGKAKARAIVAEPTPPSSAPPVEELDLDEKVQAVDIPTEKKKKKSRKTIAPPPPPVEGIVTPITPPSPSPPPAIPPAAPDPPTPLVATDTPRAVKKERVKIRRDATGHMWAAWPSTPRPSEKPARKKASGSLEKKKNSSSRRSTEREEENESKGTRSASDKAASASASASRPRVASVLKTSTPPPARTSSTREKRNSLRHSIDNTSGLISPPPEAISSKAAKILGVEESVRSSRKKKKKSMVHAVGTDDEEAFMSGALDPPSMPSPERHRRSRVSDIKALPISESTSTDKIKAVQPEDDVDMTEIHPPAPPAPPISVPLKRSSTSASAKKNNGLTSLFGRLSGAKAEPTPPKPRRRNTYAATDDEVLKRPKRSRHRETYTGDTTDFGVTDADQEARHGPRRAKRESYDRVARDEAKRRRREAEAEEFRRQEEKEARRAERRAAREAERHAAEEEERQERRRRRREEKQAAAAATAAAEDADSDARRARRHERRKSHATEMDEHEERRRRREARRAARTAEDEDPRRSSHHQESLYRRTKSSHHPTEESDRKIQTWPHSGTSSWVKDHSDAPPPPEVEHPVQIEDDETARREARRAKRRSRYEDMNGGDEDEHRRRRRERREARYREERRTGGSEESDEKKYGRRASAAMPPPPPPKQNSWWKKVLG